MSKTTIDITFLRNMLPAEAVKAVEEVCPPAKRTEIDAETLTKALDLLSPISTDARRVKKLLGDIARRDAKIAAVEAGDQEVIAKLSAFERVQMGLEAVPEKPKAASNRTAARTERQDEVAVNSPKGSGPAKVDLVHLGQMAYLNASPVAVAIDDREMIEALFCGNTQGGPSEYVQVAMPSDRGSSLIPLGHCSSTGKLVRAKLREDSAPSLRISDKSPQSFSCFADMLGQGRSVFTASADGRLLVGGFGNGEVLLVDVLSEAVVASVTVPGSGGMSCVALCNGVLAAGRERGCVHVYRVESE